MKHCPLLFSPLQQIKIPLPRILWLACSTVYGGLLKSLNELLNILEASVWRLKQV